MESRKPLLWVIGDLKTVKKSNDRLKLFLSKKHMTRLYNLSMEKIEEKDDVRLIPLEFKSENGKATKTSYISTKIDNSVKKVLSSLGVRNAMNPEKLSFQKTKNKSDKDQLVLDLGVDYLN